MDLKHERQFFNAEESLAVIAGLRRVVRHSPLYTPSMKTGSPYSIQMTNCGRAGWISDSLGYRYARRHPVTGRPWMPIPDELVAAARRLAGPDFDPDCCLINLYRGRHARLGLHRDLDEGDDSKPIVSFSFGDSCEFVIGGPKKTDPQDHILLQSGDAVLFGGSRRLAWHGVTRIFPGTSDLLDGGGRINLTLRQFGNILVHER